MNKSQVFSISKDFRLVIFGGKGGVGKTTCYAAAAIYLAKANPNKKILILSTNPTHSLSESFDQQIGDEVTLIKGMGNLYALEINSKKLLEKQKEWYKPKIDRLLKETYQVSLEREFIKNVWDLVPPGFDELMSLMNMSDLIKNNEYDVILVDTVAGAHAIRLLELPEKNKWWLNKALEPFAYMSRIPPGVSPKIAMRHMAPLIEVRDKFKNLNEDLEKLQLLLTDNTKSNFVLVTTPEKMGIDVTADMINSLKRCVVPYSTIVINYLIPKSVKCDFCASRRKVQMQHIQEIRNRFSECNIIEVPLFPKAIKGKDALINFSKALFEGRYDIKISTPKIQGTYNITQKLKLPKNIRFILFGGKGGVGKTTSSAATGIYMAKQGRKVLVITTDPQRSLSDSFDQKLPESKITQVNDVSNLYALEIDTEKTMNEFKKCHEEEIMQLAETAKYLKAESLKDFLDFVPGMDEIMALIKIAHLLAEDEYELLVLDTAPTGHTLSFLELPDIFSKWMQLLIGIRTKTRHLMYRYKRSVKYKVDLFLEELIRDAKRVKATLTSPATNFIPVTSLDDMAINETERLITSLKSHQIAVEQIIVNGLVSPNKCSYCVSAFNLQQNNFQKLRKRFHGFEIVGIPLFPHEIYGIDRLMKFANTLFG